MKCTVGRISSSVCVCVCGGGGGPLINECLNIRNSTYTTVHVDTAYNNHLLESTGRQWYPLVCVTEVCTRIA